MNNLSANKENSTIQILLLIGIFVLCAYSYHPRFFNLVLGSIQNRSIVLPAEGLILLLSCLSIRKFCLCSVTKAYFWGIFAIAFIVFMCDAIGLMVSTSAIIAMIPPFLGIMIGKNMKVNEETLLILLKIYVVAASIIGLLCIITNIGSFMIVDQYAVAGKNASGVMLSISGIIAFFSAIRPNERKMWRWFDITMLVLIFAELLTIRARLATLGLAVIIVAILIKSSMRIGSKQIFLGIVVLILLACFSLFDTIAQFVYDSFFQNKEDNLSSNRMDLNRVALSVICDSPFIGNLKGNYIIDEHNQVHNFLLKTISQYGIFFSLPWVVIYFNLLIFACKKIFQIDINDGVLFLSIVLILFLYWESLGEYTYPFGPGTITFIPFLLLGYGLNNGLFVSSRK